MQCCAQLHYCIRRSWSACLDARQCKQHHIRPEPNLIFVVELCDMKRFIRRALEERNSELLSQLLSAELNLERRTLERIIRIIETEHGSDGS